MTQVSGARFLHALTGSSTPSQWSLSHKKCNNYLDMHFVLGAFLLHDKCVLIETKHLIKSKLRIKVLKILHGKYNLFNTK